MAIGVYLRSPQGAVAGLISSIPTFAIGWVVVGLPVVVAGRRVIQIPMWVVGLLGATAAAIILFGIDREDHLYLLHHLLGLPALALVSGAAGMVIYRLLIETKN